MSRFSGGVAVKTLTDRDSMYGKNSDRRIMSPTSFNSIFGSKKITLQTTYIYVGDKTIKEQGNIEWRYYNPPSWNGRGKGEFKYDANEVMRSGRPGDLLIVGRKDKDEMSLILIEKNQDLINQVYETIGINKAPKKSKDSLMSRMFGTSSSEIIEYDIEDAPIKMDFSQPSGWIQVYFTPGTDCEDNIIKQIKNAKKMDVAVYSITNERIVNALISAKDRGAKIRIITDRLQSKGKSSLVPILQSKGFEVKTNIKHKIMHHKFAIFDGKNIETGSYNWTEAATKSNAENCLFFKQTNKEFSAQYDYLWKSYNK